MKTVGYTLLELLIAMALGLFLLAGVFMAFQTNMQSKVLQESMQQIQRNGRFAVEKMSYAIKISGYTGFYRKIEMGLENLIDPTVSAPWNVSKKVEGFNNVVAGTTILGISGFTVGSDVILLKGMSGDINAVINNTNPSLLSVPIDSGYVVGDILMVSDVDQASILMVNKIDKNLINNSLDIETPAMEFNSEAEVGQFMVQMFYIKKGDNGRPALFNARLKASGGKPILQETELTSGVENMQITYGVDTDNSNAPNEFRDSSTITNWENVVSVNLALLVVSEEDKMTLEKTSYSFDPTLMRFIKDSIADSNANRRLKRAFKTSVTLRN